MKSPEAGHEDEMSLEQEIETTLFHYLDQQPDGIAHGNMLHVVKSEPRYENVEEGKLRLEVDRVILKLQNEGKIQATYRVDGFGSVGFAWKRK